MRLVESTKPGVGTLCLCLGATGLLTKAAGALLTTEIGTRRGLGSGCYWQHKRGKRDACKIESHDDEGV